MPSILLASALGYFLVTWLLGGDARRRARFQREWTARLAASREENAHRRIARQQEWAAGEPARKAAQAEAHARSKAAMDAYLKALAEQVAASHGAASPSPAQQLREVFPALPSPTTANRLVSTGGPADERSSFEFRRPHSGASGEGQA
ncbi:hypothetical protein [Phenylobacterium montanum]|uniref:Uncharacterized protein n=1 Tax=Phenylobacterium montanum TaxID=2823693 RepID=A0A975ITN6_9CAUL|nr:hypothetical protein [Caulobacter sp. S6]QUD86958.1 hypothetical protein KCG34_18045 [Caulobacter sp. S6]